MARVPDIDLTAEVLKRTPRWRLITRRRIRHAFAGRYIRINAGTVERGVNERGEPVAVMTLHPEIITAR